MFSLFNFSSIFPVVQLTPFAPMCGRPCLHMKSIAVCLVSVGTEDGARTGAVGSHAVPRHRLQQEDKEDGFLQRRSQRRLPVYQWVENEGACPGREHGPRWSWYNHVAEGVVSYRRILPESSRCWQLTVACTQLGHIITAVKFYLFICLVHISPVIYFLFTWRVGLEIYCLLYRVSHRTRKLDVILMSMVLNVVHTTSVLFSFCSFGSFVQIC